MRPQAAIRPLAWLTSFAIACLVLMNPLLIAPTHASGVATVNGPPASPSHASGPLFVQNIGQWPSAARFQVSTSGGVFWLSDNTLWLSVSKPGSAASSEHQLGASANWRARGRATSGHGVNIALSFPGANAAPTITPFDRLSTHIAYFQGNQSQAWRSDAPVWGGVRYDNLYPGVDLVLDGAGGAWRPTLVATTGADLTAVRLRVDGARAVSLADGALRLDTAIGPLSLPLFQVRGAAVETAALVSGNDVSAPFASAAASKNTARPRVSSNLVCSTFLGGNNATQPTKVRVDGSGDAYVTGSTTATDFPVSAGAYQQSCSRQSSGGCQNVFVSELNPSGSGLTFSTYLGGNEFDFAMSLALDNSGNIYVTGVTTSTNFPTTAGAFQTSCPTAGQANGGCAFVSKLSPNGSQLLYSTLIGGHGVNGDGGADITVDSAGDAYIAGATSSLDFPITANAFQRQCNSTHAAQGCLSAALFEVNPTGSGLLYSTYFGGSGSGQASIYASDQACAATQGGADGSGGWPPRCGGVGGRFEGCERVVGPCGRAANGYSWSLDKMEGCEGTRASRPSCKVRLVESLCLR